LWLAECLARQGRHDEAWQVFDLTVSTINDLGLICKPNIGPPGEAIFLVPNALTVPQ